ncbi:alpha/beta hydrolase family protein [Thalassotalea sp. PS06]|uniref:alpha/beta hydrolase family protein n=1 Tax=Thalassotalea sp. PS06 TaxID=2594005 RepID=UPI00116336AE|nr:S9 family peptidase [Thalassotalea sp. PS06]QDP00673.1 S9 family peptidase [Thalassotalea sp. PS06]
MKYISIFFCFLLSISSASALELSDFTRHMQNEQAKISPDGKHIAIRTLHEGKYILAFVRTDDKKLTFTFKMSGKQQVGNYRWVNNERVVIDVLSTYGALGQTYDTGRLFAINYDGSRPKAIFGTSQGVSEGKITRKKKVGNGWASVLSLYEKNDKEIIISIQPWKRRHLEPSPAEVIKLNVYNGHQKKIMRSPGRGNNILLDHNDEVRFATGIEGYGETRLYYREPKGEWQDFDTGIKADETIVQGFSADNKNVYFIAYKDGDTGTLYSFNLETKKASKIYNNEFVVPTYVLTNYKNVPYGIRIDEDYSNYLIFNKKVEHAKLHQDLYKAFKGDSVDIASSTKDGENLIVFVRGDRNPGAYYLYNTDKNQARFLFNRADWLKKEDLAVVEPFKFKTRDGITLNGYLTLPNGKEVKDLPLVVMPHGGPRARDYWSYDFRSQYLAAKGYAVLKVNFRGSNGFGDKIMHMGDKHWGTKVQYDIIDATKWAIKSGIADADRVCISGGSFGAYSALQSSAIEPDMFKCTIGSSGVYDLKMMHSKGDIPGGLYGPTYLNEAVGQSPEVLKNQSPVNLVSQLKAPVLLIHGSADVRTPIEQAEALEDKLNEHNHPYEKLYIDNEYHGFIVEENRLKAAEAIVNFLDKHIGS